MKNPEGDHGGHPWFHPSSSWTKTACSQWFWFLWSWHVDKQKLQKMWQQICSQTKINGMCRDSITKLEHANHLQRGIGFPVVPTSSIEKFSNPMSSAPTSISSAKMDTTAAGSCWFDSRAVWATWTQFPQQSQRTIGVQSIYVFGLKGRNGHSAILGFYRFLSCTMFKQGTITTNSKNRFFASIPRKAVAEVSREKERIGQHSWFGFTDGKSHATNRLKPDSVSGCN